MMHVVIFVEIGSSVGCKLAQKLIDEKDTHASFLRLPSYYCFLNSHASNYLDEISQLSHL